MQRAPVWTDEKLDPSPQGPPEGCVPSRRALHLRAECAFALGDLSRSRSSVRPTARLRSKFEGNVGIFEGPDTFNGNP